MVAVAFHGVGQLEPEGADQVDGNHPYPGPRDLIVPLQLLMNAPAQAVVYEVLDNIKSRPFQSVTLDFREPISVKSAGQSGAGPFDISGPDQLQPCPFMDRLQT